MSEKEKTGKGKKKHEKRKERGPFHPVQHKEHKKSMIAIRPNSRDLVFFARQEVGRGGGGKKSSSHRGEGEKSEDGKKRGTGCPPELSATFLRAGLHGT